MSTKTYCASMIRYDLKEVRVKSVVLIDTIVVLTLKHKFSYIRIFASLVLRSSVLFLHHKIYTWKSIEDGSLE